MVQFRAIDRRRNPQQLMRQFTQNKEQLQKEVYREIAEEIADVTRQAAIRAENPRRGAVDTGTYARNQDVALRSGSFSGDASSHGKTRGVAPGPPIRAGLNQMLEGIESLPPKADNVVFRNHAAHAGIVERDYKIYAQARNTAPQIIKSVAARLGLTPKGGGK